MPHRLIYFFSHLFSTSVIFTQIQVNANEIEDNDQSDFTKRKVMKIKSLYQILYCKLHGGKEKSHSIYLYPTVYTKSAKTEKF